MKSWIVFRFPPLYPTRNGTLIRNGTSECDTFSFRRKCVWITQLYASSKTCPVPRGSRLKSTAWVRSWRLSAAYCFSANTGANDFKQSTKGIYSSRSCLASIQPDNRVIGMWLSQNIQNWGTLLNRTSEVNHLQFSADMHLICTESSSCIL